MVLLLLVVVVLAAVAIYRPSHVAPQSVPVGEARVFASERLAKVHPQLRELILQWEREGTFHVYVASGLRTAEEQFELFKQNLTKASTPIDSPHGRGAAVDIHPLGFDDAKCFSSQPWALEAMNSFGAWAESKGAVWGGRFGGFYGPCKEVEGDRPHIELKGWKSLPYPPPDYSEVPFA